MPGLTIQIEGVSKAFAGRPAVRGLSLSVPEGGVFGLLGHNGAGKSTTLGMLLGQVFPDSGRLAIHGHDVFAERGSALREVGAIFESPCFYDYLTGHRNLRIFCDYTAPAARSRIDEVVELVGLTERIHHKVGVYSHGMRQRLALAQALLPGPRTLVLDEPSDGLDPEGIAAMRQLIQKLNRDYNLTILFSSHLLSEVEHLCTEVAVMHRGEMVFCGDWSQTDFGKGLTQLDVGRREQALALLNDRGMLKESLDHSRVVLKDDTTTAAVNRLLIEHGFDVAAIAPVKLSLEDFYMQLIDRPSQTQSAGRLDPGP
ncbi:MAG: ABC transporter ATP-binding protein [Planctomycetota bacterium]